MKKQLFAVSLLSVLCFAPVYGQITSDPLINIYTSECEGCQLISIQGTMFSNPAIEIQSSAYFIPLQLANDQLFQSVFDKMKESDLFAQEFEGSILYSIPISSKKKDLQNNLSFYLRGFAEQQAYMPKDAFRLLIKGNSVFAGESVTLSQSSYLTTAYQEFSVNYNSLRKLANSKKLGYGFGLSFLNGSFINELNINDGSVYTSAIGDSIHAKLDLSLLQSDPEQNNFLSSNGMGAALNLHLYYQFENGNSIYTSVNRLGFINWNQNSLQYRIDSSFSFTGVDIISQNPFDKTMGEELDSLLAINSNSTSMSYRYYLAPEINAVFQIKHLFDKAKLNLGLAYRISPHYIPRSFVTINYQLVESFYIQAGINSDQFGNIGACFEFGLSVKDFLRFKLGTNHLEGLGLYGVNGQGVYTGLQLMF